MMIVICIRKIPRIQALDLDPCVQTSWHCQPLWSKIFLTLSTSFVIIFTLINELILFITSTFLRARRKSLTAKWLISVEMNWIWSVNWCGLQNIFRTIWFKLRGKLMSWFRMIYVLFWVTIAIFCPILAQ